MRGIKMGFKNWCLIALSYGWGAGTGDHSGTLRIKCVYLKCPK